MKPSSKTAGMEAPRCQCDDLGRVDAAFANWYDPVNELPFANHEPEKCRCVNDLAQYQRGEEVLWLCSCCHQSGDVRLELTTLTTYQPAWYNSGRMRI